MPDTENAGFTIDHVGIAVPDIDAAVRFFTEHLDAQVVFELPRIDDPTGGSAQRLGARPDQSFAVTMLRIGSASIELVQWWPETEAPAGPAVANAAHLALAVSDVEAAWHRLGAVPGVEKLGTPVRFDSGPTPGLTNAFVRTAWGLLLELMQWPAGD